MNEAQATSQGVFVLGMHRSGTSALARVLNLLSFHLGDSLLGAGEGNSTGHWEPIPVIEINERVLAALGRTWSDLRQMQPDWLQNADVRGLLPEASLLLAREYVPHHRWSIKDPRICRLLPFWLQALSQQSSVRCSAVIAVRHPWEVAASLNRRDGLPLSHGLLLWWQHTRAALVNSRGLSRAVVSFSDLLQNWAGEVERITDALDIVMPEKMDAPAQEIASFLDPGARHEVHNSSLHSIPGVLQEFYDALCSARDEDSILALEDRVLRIDFAVESHELALADLYVHRERLHHRVVDLEIASQGDRIRASAEKSDELKLELRKFSEHLSHADWVNTELERKYNEAEGALASVATEARVQAELRASLEQRLVRFEGLEDELAEMEKQLHEAEKRHREQLEQNLERLAQLRQLEVERDSFQRENRMLAVQCREHLSTIEELSAERDKLAQNWYARLFKAVGQRGK